MDWNDWWVNGGFMGKEDRDPFGEAPPGPDIPAATMSATPMVTAVWRQDGATYALMDGRMIREGDIHRGLRLAHCEAGAVWLSERFLSRRWAIEFVDQRGGASALVGTK